MKPLSLLAFAGLVAACVIGSSSAFAQAGPARIGVLAVSTQDAARPSIDAFKKRLQELGYVEGQNVRYLERYADSDMYKLRRLADELVSNGVAVLYAAATPEASAAKGTVE